LYSGLRVLCESSAMSYSGGYGDAAPHRRPGQSVSVDSFLKDSANSANEEIEVSSNVVPVFDPGQPCGDVAVDHPETQSEMGGMNKYTTYQVNGVLNGSSFTSRKRYSDFLWLRTALCKCLPGMFLPELPGKHAIGRFDAEFLEERRQGLQQFLRRLFQRSEISIGLPLVLNFLASTKDELLSLKADVEARPIANLQQDYATVFGELLADNAPPKSDKGFQMVKGFLELHVPLLKAAQVSTVALQKAEAAMLTQSTDVGKALQALTDEETDLLTKAGQPQTQLRQDLLERLSQDIQFQRAGRATQTLSASLQREIEDCEAAQESLLSIENLQQRLLAARHKISIDSASLASLRGEATPSNADASPMASSVDMRKRDKTKEFFGKIKSTVCDVAAKSGLNKDKRMAELADSIERDSQECVVLEAFIDAVRTVFSATEITAFLETKVAGCMWAQAAFSAQKAELSEALKVCWGCTA